MRLNGKSVRGMVAFLIVLAAVLATVGVVLANDYNGPVIHATSGSNGRIDPSGDVPVEPGGSQTFTMTPASGYHVEDVLVDGISIGAVASYTFSDLNDNASISVTFAQDTVSVHASAGSNGRIDPSGDVPVGWGGSQTFRMRPASGYHVEDVLVDGISVGPVTRYTFNNLNDNASISVIFAQDTNEIYVSAHGPGRISPLRSVAVPVGADQTITMTPMAGGIVVDVQVNGRSVGAVTSYTFQNVTRSHNIRVTFGWASNSITASATRNGAIFPTGRVPIPPSGGDLPFIIAPAEHYHIGDVLVDGISVGAVPNYRFVNVLGQHTIRAIFELDSYAIAANTEGNGSISSSGITVVGHAADDAFRMAAQEGSGSIISPSGIIEVGYATDAVFTMRAQEGYHVADVLVDGESVGAVNTYAFMDVAAPHTISARFAVDGTWRISVSRGEGGIIQPTSTETGTLMVMNGNNQTFTINPKRKYYIADVQVDGLSVGPLTTYTFANITADHTITATFGTRLFTISARSGANGSISPSGEEIQVPYGGSQGFTISANQGYEIDNVTVDGSDKGAITSWTFSDITKSHTIYAHFREIDTGGDGAMRRVD